MRFPCSVEFFCLLTATIRAGGHYHARGWSRASTQMVANKKRKVQSKQGKIYSEVEKMRSDFLSDNQWVISCGLRETCSPPKGIKGTREGYIADFSFRLRLS